MIRYDISQEDLHAAIEQMSPRWLEQAAERTAAYDDAKRYVKPPSDIWTEVKRVYMGLQRHKCGYCERRLEHSEVGNSEFDVEHFRPKSMVTSWPPASRTDRGADFDFPLGTTSKEVGYYLLPHNPDNYLVSCKTCNSSFKGTAFPVAGDRQIDLPHPRTPVEQAYLCYPLGSFDADPEELITFHGYVPVPTASEPHARRRGQVIIRFFDLDVREGLIYERSLVITGLFLALSVPQTATPMERLVADSVIAAATSTQAPHTNCARSFVRSWEQSVALAETFADAAMQYLAHV